jgi:hypothetical protein
VTGSRGTYPLRRTRASPLAVASPDVDAMVAWLQSERVVDPDGAVKSWDNPANPGYSYPEISGLLLSLLAQSESADPEVRDRIAENLCGGVGAGSAVGRWGINYVFDTAMVLSGLLAYEAAGGLLPDPGIPDRLYGFIVEGLLARLAIDGPIPPDPNHWSNSYGCHLLKASLSLTAYSERRWGGRTDLVVRQLLDDLLPLQEDGRFRTNSASRISYLHAHCYATEGLLVIRRRGLADVDAAVVASADWLVRAQDESGGIRAWHDGAEASGELRADASAQAIRIWRLVDRRRYADSIRRGLGFIADSSVDGAGVTYRPGSDDINTWATIFAIQAATWFSGEADALWLI